jgi:hypothetical protein
MLGNGESFASSVIASAILVSGRIFIWFRFRESGDRILIIFNNNFFELDLIYVEHILSIQLIHR